jgi:hypothetical protein
MNTHNSACNGILRYPDAVPQSPSEHLSSRVRHTSLACLCNTECSQLTPAISDLRRGSVNVPV